jgi:mono/diheme cytochrome c family protein
MRWHKHVVAAGTLLAAALAFAGSSASSPTLPAVQTTSADEMHERWMLEGQKRYATNCGRCHQPPHRLSPRVMAMAVRHMRVRAMLTDDDTKYLLYYMTH